MVSKEKNRDRRDNDIFFVNIYLTYFWYYFFKLSYSISFLKIERNQE